jgi:hypothetical protein
VAGEEERSTISGGKGQLYVLLLLGLATNVVLIETLGIDANGPTMEEIEKRESIMH